MEKSFVFDEVTYNAKDFRDYFASFIGNGVFPNPSSCLQIIANNDMTVKIKQGKGWIDGALYMNTDDYTLAIDPADGVLNRIDRIVLRCDYLTRNIKAKVKKGTFASSPTAQILQRDADAYELALADVYVGKGIISITQSAITDLRMNNELCGVVHGVVSQIDLTTIFNQFITWYEEVKANYQSNFQGWSSDKRQEFQDYFNSVKDILNQEVAGNLTREVLDIKEVLKRIAYYNDYGIALDEETGIWTERQWKKQDGKLYMQSLLSNRDIEYRYTKDTWEIYKDDGITLDFKVIWTLTYRKNSSTPENKTYVIEVI